MGPGQGSGCDLRDRFTTHHCNPEKVYGKLILPAGFPVVWSAEFGQVLLQLSLEPGIAHIPGPHLH